MATKIEEVKQKLSEYGNTAEENIGFFSQYEKRIAELESITMGTQLRALFVQSVARECEEKVGKRLAALKSELGVEIMEDAMGEDIKKVVQERVKGVREDIKMLREKRRELIGKFTAGLANGTGQLLEGVQAVTFVEAIKAQEEELSSLESNLDTCEAMMNEVEQLVFTTTIIPV